MIWLSQFLFNVENKILTLLKPSCFIKPSISFKSEVSKNASVFLDTLDVESKFSDNSFERKKINHLYNGLCNGNRAALAESITLVESLNKNKKAIGQILLQKVLNHLKCLSKEGNFTKYMLQNRFNIDKSYHHTLRIGITGSPGAGKSTFIEKFGLYLTQHLGFKVAVLAIDPSSGRTGGSLLGDKTRMLELSNDPLAYIRPSPSKGELGGVARNTMEALLLCEGCGYDVIIVETVGVGQSEVAVAYMTDMFVLLIPPAGGDELQGLKRGIIENCDFILVNKSDGDLVPAARRIQTEYTSALKFIPRKYKGWRPRVRRISSLTGDGISHFWEFVVDFYNYLLTSNNLQNNRKKQTDLWMWNHIRSDILLHFQTDPNVQLHISQIKEMVKNGTITPGLASDYLLEIFFSKFDTGND